MQKECTMLSLPFKSIFSDQVKIVERTIDGQQLKWSTFRDFPASKMYETIQEWVFPFIKNLHSDKNSAYSKYMDDAIFKLPTPLVLSKVSIAGRNGQFRTPRHIIRMMVELMKPTPKETICESKTRYLIQFNVA